MTLERSTRARVTTVLVLAMVLGAGVVLGMAIDRRLAPGSAQQELAPAPGERPGGENRSRGFDPRGRNPNREASQARDSAQRRPPLIVEQVGLTEVQEAQVDSILGFYRTQMRVLHEEFNEAYSSRYREIILASREAIRGILTADQRVAYDSLLVAWDRRRQERRADSASEGQGGTDGS